MRKRIKYKNIFVLGFTVPFLSLAAVGNAQAQECAALPTCEEFGYLYTAEECAGQKYVKCPFDQTKYFCLEDNNSGGSCNVGDILYSDKTCSSEVIGGKTPIGVVFNPEKGLAIGLKTELKYWLAWNVEIFDVPDLTNYSSDTTVKADWAGKSNTNIAVNYCKSNNKSCFAFEYVNTYKTEGTNAGDWYLPALGELNNIYENKDILNMTLSKIGGIQLPASDHWSSSEYADGGAWSQYFYNGIFRWISKTVQVNYVRPVLAYKDTGM